MVPRQVKKEDEDKIKQLFWESGGVDQVVFIDGESSFIVKLASWTYYSTFFKKKIKYN